MSQSQRGRRWALVGLAGALLALTTLSIVGAASTRHSADLVRRSASLSEDYNSAHNAVAAEESLERKYRLEPGPEVRNLHRQAEDDLHAALRKINAEGTAADRHTVEVVSALHVSYAEAIIRMFAAVDVGNTPEVLKIDNTEVDPSFGRISDIVQAATDEHIRLAAQANADLHRVENIVFATNVAGFAVGLALILVFAWVAVGYHRTVLRQANDSKHQALHDPLTGLPNRTLFTELVTEALAGGGYTGVLLLDLDRFKEVNDTLGHQYGDDLLRAVASRTVAAVRHGDTVARLSGDEFAVLLPGADATDAAALAERLLAELHQSFIIGEVVVDVEASVGVAVAPTHAGTTEALLRCADIAMYAARDAKTGALLYRADMHTEDANRLQLLGDLRRALDAGDQLSLHYQPKVSLPGQELRGVEALIRWQHPTRGPVSPAEFIPIAETTGLINRLTLYVLRQAIGQARSWLEEGTPVPVAVNLSSRCLLDPHLVADIVDLLNLYNLPTDLVRLEVTETAIMANPSLAMSTLSQLHDLGIRLSIDDYGTGYSSMAYLKRLPVDELKVDRTFVLNMDSDREDAVLVRGAIELGHNLGLTVVAEGVETPAHVAALRQLGCDVAQGYHYAKPMPADDLTAWMRTHQLNAGRPAVV
jgi:diguanylate cyclase (GGDEF)-like protein